MDIRAMLEKLDGLYVQGNLKDAEALLDQSLINALGDRNLAAALTIYNEMEGLYRTTGRAQKAAEISDSALGLIKIMKLQGTVHHATTLLNGATANRVANNLDKALQMYLEATEILENNNFGNSYQMASVHNNISHIYQEKGMHRKALHHLETAAKMIAKMPDNAAEVATTDICTALSYMALGNTDTAQKFVDKAMVYYNSADGMCDGHRGSALSAQAELCWRKGDHKKAIEIFEAALAFTLERFGESDGCAIIRRNIETVRREMQNTTHER